MSNKFKYTISGIFFLLFILSLPLRHEKVQEDTVAHKKEVIKAKTSKKLTTVNTNSNKVASKKETSKKRTTNKKEKVIIQSNAKNHIALTKVSFEELPGWDEADVKKSLLAFQKSCKTLLKQKPSNPTGSEHIKLKAGDWHPACKAAVALESISEDTAKIFFEKWFHPLEFEQKKPVSGLFTGYYMTRIDGSLHKTAKYTTPIYGLPKGKGQNNSKRSIHYTREQIDNGVIKKIAPVIAWIHSPIERLFLEIEGSGVIQLTNGEKIYLGYAGENGAPYTSISKVLIDRGIMTKHNASKSSIMRYLETHADKANDILHKNKSFVFFENLKKPIAIGAQDITLTPGYSLAIDKKWIPLGAPLWLNTKTPDVRQDSEKRFQRLMIAQDTGGAIHGFMRGDIYWGTGKIATYLGEHMKNGGHYWLLLPKHIFNRLAKRSL